jgi:spore coat polysaccharide biosynthesis protein SpsF
MTAAAIIQARMGSSRLPGKVLRPIAGRPLLGYMLERVQRAALVDRIVVATTQSSADDPVERLCRDLGVATWRGSEDDVLDRMVLAARSATADEVIRLTADCPLIDPGLIDAVVRLRRAEDADYATNTLPPTFPDGLDVEVMTMAALETAAAEARLPSQREHVTPFLRDDPGRFRHANLAAPADFSHLRWTVDVAEDLAVVERLAELLAASGRGSGWLDALAAMTGEPELLRLNRHVTRNEGYARSLLKDSHDHA